MSTMTLPAAPSSRAARVVASAAAKLVLLARAFAEVRADVRRMQIAAHHEHPFIGL
jgi:hypothetical protein